MAVAAVRREVLNGDVLADAVDDVAQACQLATEDYLDMLDRDPLEIARVLGQGAAKGGA